MKKSWALRRGAEGVSPIIGSILMVTITVVLVAVLMTMAGGFGGNSATPGLLVLSKGSVDHGYRITLTDPTSQIVWGDVMVQLRTENSAVAWSNLTSNDLTSSVNPTVWKYGSSKVLDDLNVFLNITDLAGNGRINQGDCLTFTTYSEPTFNTGRTYIVTLVDTLTGNSLLSTNLITA
jgi:flagellin-like protein